MNFVGPFAIGLVIGLALAPIAAYWHYRMLMRRFRAIQDDENYRLKLQKHRQTVDSGRDHPPVEGAGPPGEVHNLFATRPGVLERAHIAETNARKSAKRVD